MTGEFRMDSWSAGGLARRYAGGSPARSTGPLAIFLVASLLFVATASAATLDSFDSVAGWRPMPATGVSLNITSDAGRAGKAMRLDFDFQGHGGYAIARRNGLVELPDDFEIAFWIRAVAPVNTLEIKLIDESGENVWWTTRREFEFPKEWRRISIKKRQIEFAWGPTRDRALPRRIGSLEIVVTAGTGGKGTVWIDELTLSPLTGTRAPLPSPTPPWKSQADGAQSMLIDLGQRQELGGLLIDWDPEDYATRYSVAVTIDGKEWETVRRVEGSNGGRDHLDLHDTDARSIRLDLAGSSRGRGYAIRSVTVKPPEWARTPNDFFASVARDSLRGDWPRTFYGEQTYWTIVGADGDAVEALVGEDGAVELGDARLSLEPFVWVDGRLVTWADAEASHSLEMGYLPIPTVEWRTRDVRLTVTAWVSGAAGASTLSVRYRLDAPESARLYLAVRPFQVNPSSQFLARIGGVGRIELLAWDGSGIAVAAPRPIRITPRTVPSAFGATTYDGGNIVEYLRRNALPPAQTVTDPVGFASAAMQFDARDVVVDVPISGAGAAPLPMEEVARGWDEKVNRVRIEIPDRRWSDSIRTTLAYVLINRDGPSIQPGSRSYDRSWIRDGSLTSAALLRLGHEDLVRDFVRWYAKHQYPDGRVPCCVSSVGADPVPENDSHGEFVFLVAEYFRYTRDRAVAGEMWPHVAKAVAYIDTLRHQRMTAEYQTGDKRVFYGLLPESISHEGYSAKPMHSYWDDLFALVGLKDAAWLAAALGMDDEAARIGRMRDEFRRDLVASISLSMRQHGVDYIPGAAELGDFDATSTTVYLSPGGEFDLLPEAMRRTFEKYWENFVARRDGALEWDGYTPYEWRCVGALVRLGETSRAHEAARFFFADQRPPEWNEWSEGIHREKRQASFIGDMPHTWVGTDFIRSAIDMIAYDRRDGSIVVGAGVLPEWLERGVRVDGLRTPYGRLSLAMSVERNEAVIRIAAGMEIPPGGIVVVSPLDRKETIVRKLPAEVRFPR